MRYNILPVLCFLLFSCSTGNGTNAVVSAHAEENAPSKRTGDIEQWKATYKKKLKDIRERQTPDSLKQQLFSYISETVPSFWVGTPWDFNGTSRVPIYGEIACGYFVTNTLYDFGLDIKRIHLAQQASSVLIKEVCAKETIKTLTSFDKLESYLKTRTANQVYIVGLDFHVGYLYYDGKDGYFLHSNYINSEGVICEKATTSKALNHSNIFVVGSLSDNIGKLKFQPLD